MTTNIKAPLLVDKENEGEIEIHEGVTHSDSPYKKEEKRKKTIIKTSNSRQCSWT